MTAAIAETKRAAQVQAMFGDIAPRYDVANTVLSAGIDRLWRRALLRAIDEHVATEASTEARVALDLCTGTGDLLPGLKQRFSTVVGIDFCRPMLEVNQTRHPDSRASLLMGDALKLPLADRSADVVCVAWGVRNFENLSSGLAEIRRVLKPSGHLFVLEFGQPQPGLFAQVYSFYSRFIMPLIGGALTGHRAAYEYLPATSRTFPCGADFQRVLFSSGFKSSQARPLFGGIAYLYVAAEKL